MRNDTLVSYLIHSPDFEAGDRRRELAERNLVREHDEYLRSWRQRMRAALQQSPMPRVHVS